MTTTLAAAGLFLAAACGSTPPPTTGASGSPDDTATAPANSAQVTTPAAPAAGRPSPTRPKGPTVNPRKVRWQKVRPSKDGRRLTVIWWSGVEPCSVLDRVGVRETAKRVTVTLYEGQARGAEDVACIEIAVQKSTTVKLNKPLGHRKIIDGAKP
ncbi:hypothetical protein Sme01_60360 [Sphaerisporangium melleum]|uniref:Uncharacterized protein n=1 Tax=Sphaerisporangium melleum TaxID=321316 RepID=A0A917RBF6_9ACTN|nr:hypothetical protein [Sphaerisporangium melleum]GGK99137.1 hypothetical protein GCM10007964_46550 [Sphaerisporangium melleum]GII73560.1 hypothetical protein Sme01_60360 [Sphaerisporangium melleum]